MRAVPIAITTTSQVVVNINENTSHVGFRGFTLAEAATTAAAAQVRIRENSGTGTILANVRLAASTSATQDFAEGVFCNGDLYFELVSGAVSGSLFVD